MNFPSVSARARNSSRVSEYFFETLSERLSPKVHKHYNPLKNSIDVHVTWGPLSARFQVDPLVMDTPEYLQDLEATILRVFGEEFSKLQSSRRFSLTGEACDYCNSPSRDINGQCSACGAY